MEEPMAEPEPAAIEEPMAEPEPAAMEEPMAEPEPAAIEEPMAEPEPAAMGEPMVESEPIAMSEPLQDLEPIPDLDSIPGPEAQAPPELESMAELEPKPETETMAMPEPVLSSIAEPDSMAVLEQLAAPEPMAVPEQLTELDSIMNSIAEPEPLSLSGEEPGPDILSLSEDSAEPGPVLLSEGLAEPELMPALEPEAEAILGIEDLPVSLDTEMPMEQSIADNPELTESLALDPTIINDMVKPVELEPEEVDRMLDEIMTPEIPETPELSGESAIYSQDETPDAESAGDDKVLIDITVKNQAEDSPGEGENKMDESIAQNLEGIGAEVPEGAGMVEVEEPLLPDFDEGPVSDETGVITDGMVVRGDIQTIGSLDVLGEVNGNLIVKGKLNISGAVNGNSKASEIFADSARIQGEVISTGAVKVGQESVIIGNISATSAVIAGAVKGDIDVHGPVILDTSAIVMGDIKSKSVQINNGAVIEGHCSQCYADISPTTFFDDLKKNFGKKAS